jgi:tetratricopeptide (TPR) repeat protein
MRRSNADLQIANTSLTITKNLARETMKPADFAREIYDQAAEIGEPYSSLTVAERSAANDLWVRFNRLEAVHGTLPYSDRLRPMLLSKIGRYQEAVEATQARYQELPNWETAIAVANAARRAGDLELAVTMFLRATEHDPEDITCWLEVGDIRLEEERFAESLQAYERVLAVEGDHAWALPSAFFCRWRLQGQSNWLQSLQELANQEGCTCGMEGCLTQLFGGYGSADGIARAEYLLEKLGGGK